MKSYTDALQFAAKHLAEQTRIWSAAPAIIHSEAVVDLLIQIGIHDPVTLQSAALHDVLEDSNSTAAETEMLAEFGTEVTNIVKELTNPPGMSGAQAKVWQSQHAGTRSIPATTIKVADKTCNLEEIVQDWPYHSGSKQFRRFAVYYLKTSKMVVGACTLARIPQPLLGRFHRTCHKLQDLLEEFESRRDANPSV